MLSLSLLEPGSQAWEVDALRWKVSLVSLKLCQLLKQKHQTVQQRQLFGCLLWLREPACKDVG